MAVGRGPRTHSGTGAAQRQSGLPHSLRVSLQHPQAALQPGQPIQLGRCEGQCIQAVGPRAGAGRCLARVGRLVRGLRWVGQEMAQGVVGLCQAVVQRGSGMGRPRALQAQADQRQVRHQPLAVVQQAQHLVGRQALAAGLGGRALGCGGQRAQRVVRAAARHALGDFIRPLCAPHRQRIV